MKVLRLHEIGGPERLVLEDIDKPEPDRGEVRVALKAAALNRRDVWITVGAYPRIQLPAVCGSDGSGIIDAVGSGVDKRMVGCEVVIYPARDWGDDPRCGGEHFRVLGMPDQGTFAEFICVPQDSVVDKPGHLSWAEAAAIPLAGMTAWRAAVTHGEVRNGQKVLVTGIGGGCAGFAMMWALGHGGDVFVTSSSEEKIASACALGASAGFNYRAENWGRAVRDATGGIDLVIDSSGGDGIHEALDTLNPGGRYIFFGATQGNAAAGLNMAKLFFRQIRIQGTTMGRPAEFRAMVNYVRDQSIKPVIDAVFPFNEGILAHRKLLDSEQMGKIVLEIA